MASTNYFVLKDYYDRDRNAYATAGLTVAFDPAIAAQVPVINSLLAGNVIMLSSGVATSTHPLAITATKLATAPT